MGGGGLGLMNYRPSGVDYQVGWVESLAKVFLYGEEGGVAVYGNMVQRNKSMVERAKKTESGNNEVNLLAQWVGLSRKGIRCMGAWCMVA